MSVRASLRDRSRPSAREIRYRIYTGSMLAITVGAPVARTATLWVVDRLPASAGVIPPETVLAVIAAFAVLAACCVACGARIGPARAPLPEIDLLLATPLSRARALAPVVVRTGLWFALLGAAGGGVLGAALVVAYGFALWHVLLVLTGAAAGLLLTIAALLGQSSRALRATASSALAAAGLVVGGLAARWSGLLPEAAGASSVGISALAVLLVLVAVGALGAPALMRSLGVETLRSQALRQRAVGAAMLTADSRTALARLGAPVRFGRGMRWRPLRVRASALRGLRLVVTRDLLGLLRTPLRTCLAVISVGAAAALAVSAILGSPVPAPVPLLGAAAALVASGGASGLMRGYRAAAEGVGGPSLFPYPAGRLLAAHLAVPAVTVLGVGAGVAWAVGKAAGVPPLLAVCVSASICASGCAVAAVNALQGPLPMRMLAPVQTPAGDASGLVVLAWMLSGPVAGAAAGVLIALSWSAAPFGVAMAVSAAVLALCVSWWHGRLRAAVDR